MGAAQCCTLAGQTCNLSGCVLRACFQHGQQHGVCITAPLTFPRHPAAPPSQAYDVHWLAATVAGGAGVEALGEGIAAVEQAGELEAASADYAPEVRPACCACSSGKGCAPGIVLCSPPLRPAGAACPSSAAHAVAARAWHNGIASSGWSGQLCITENNLVISYALAPAGRHHGRLGRGQLPRPHAGAHAQTRVCSQALLAGRLGLGKRKVPPLLALQPSRPPSSGSARGSNCVLCLCLIVCVACASCRTRMTS